jgi:hypothetical protein
MTWPRSTALEVINDQSTNIKTALNQIASCVKHFWDGGGAFHLKTLCKVLKED